MPRKLISIFENKMLSQYHQSTELLRPEIVVTDGRRFDMQYMMDILGVDRQTVSSYAIAPLDVFDAYVSATPKRTKEVDHLENGELELRIDIVEEVE
ncbi:hypothetical protein QVD17_36292 [Tagetes erecta]|uniref:Uncharacterized protein n=1 Tax=Tagetes erecta TaxID=13708 RepID=A0AAD8JTV2_TARER|nr:hypothetical protein QVD17_36292 [Tagetes erecta]